MECDICGKTGNNNSFLHCITCARSALEQPRIELAKTLIDRDGVEKHVQAVIEGSEDRSSQHVSLTDSKGGLLVDRRECTNNVELQRTRAETAEVQERMQIITGQAQKLRKEMEAIRQEIEERQAANAQRKSDLSSATYGIDSRRTGELDKVQHGINRMDYKSDKTHHDTIDMRTHLCATAARLAGLKATKRKTKDGGIKDVFNIGPGTRVRIWDLRDLNDAPPDHLSASLGAVAQLVVRVAGYLGVRLPAEITVPHHDYPQPTIFSPSSSYQGRKVPFPGSTPSHSSSNSPEASRTIGPRHPLPKPRTLFLDRPLSHLSAEDPPAYSAFIEGVSLLGFNIAWLCRTQGMRDNFKYWEDVCPLGRNLYRLLVAQETRLAQRPENPLDKDRTQTRSTSKMAIKKLPVGFGELSHATSHSFLHTAENAQYLGGWTLTPTKITDELKSFLLAEQQAQEWDVVNQKEWEDMENAMREDPVFIGDQRRGGRAYLTRTASDRKTRAPSEDASDSGQGEGRRKGTHGWTKLKSRSDDVVKKAAGVE